MKPKQPNGKLRRILLVDDHPMVRDWLRQLIEREEGWEVCGEASSAAEALELLRSLKPDLAVCDLSMPDNHGVELIKSIRAGDKQVRLLVLSTHDEAMYAERALKAGASGYITKQEAGDKIKEAIQNVLDGKGYLSQGLSTRLVHKLSPTFGSQGEVAPIDALSDRELEIFKRIGRGHGRQQIADALGIGVKTVDSYTDRLREKLNVREARELLQRAIEFNRLQGF